MNRVHISLIGLLSLLLCNASCFATTYSVSYLKEFSTSRKTDSLIAACGLLELQDGPKVELCEAYFKLGIGLWQEGQYEGLEDLGLHIREIAKSAGLTKWEAKSENLLGNIYSRRAMSNEQ